MLFKKKLLLSFILLYLLSIGVFTLTSLMAIRSVLIGYAYEHMENYAKPIIDFYSEAYKDIDNRVNSLVEDLTSEDIYAVVVDGDGRIVSLRPFFDEEDASIFDDTRVFLSRKKGVYNDYAYITKKLDNNHTVILFFKLEPIHNVQSSIVKFILLTSSMVSLLILLVVPPIVKKFLEPLGYLTAISQRISKEGPLSVEMAEPKSMDEFGQLQRAYKNMVERLKTVISWQTNYMRDITHALNTPLTYIKGQVELMSMGSYPESELKHILHKVLQQTNKMEALIKKLMLLMRLESQVPLSKKPFSINQLFAELEEEYEFIREVQRFKVEYCLEDVQWEGDYDYIKIAIRNLLENAHKYTPSGGSIRLYYEDDCIVVEDSGVGIENKELIFETFYRADTERDGFGLGLAIVKAIAQRQGLRLSVDSEKGRGSKFCLCRVL